MSRTLPPHLFVSSAGDLYDTRATDWSSRRPLRPGYCGHFGPRDRVLTLSEVKAALRAGGYAWPGGYTLYFIADDGGPLHFECVRRNFRSVAESIRYDIRDGWRVKWIASAEGEDDDACAHCGKPIAGEA